MRRDSIFYKLFQQSPNLLFALLPNSPKNANRYRFDSVAVKEAKFEIDGVFLPPKSKNPGPVYFVEVQFQKDEMLYERALSESSLYFYRNRKKFSNWQIIVIYPSRKMEQTEIIPFESMLNSGKIYRVYLNELGDISKLPLWVALMVLTTLDETQAPQEARNLITRSRQQAPEKESGAIIELITTIIVYKFEQMSQKEVETMLGITTIQQTRVYQEAKEEGREEQTVNIIIRQLTKRFPRVAPETRDLISGLPLSVLEDLSEAILDFSQLADLQPWLDAHR
jgi:predicted transposase/invertase (TIGR01784 family)